MKSRRQFLQAALAVSATYRLPRLAATEAAPRLRLGIIADLHKDLVPDADARLQAFIDMATSERLDGILQLGDFCQARPRNLAFLEIFNRFAGPKYHVLGNHDMDGGFSREQAMAFWRMPARYYSFDLGGCHFVVLDGNDRPDGWKSGYPHFLAADQVAWLEADLAKTERNTFIFSHQSLERPMCIDNQVAVRALLEKATHTDGSRKVAACLNGHWHIDHARTIGGIPYIHINSASYYYLEGKWKKGRLDAELARTSPIFANSAGYTGPLFTVLEVDGAAGKFVLRGMKTQWLGPSPQELAYHSTEVENDWLRPEISPVAGSLPGA